MDANVNKLVVPYISQDHSQCLEIVFMDVRRCPVAFDLWPSDLWFSQMFYNLFKFQILRSIWQKRYFN